MNQPAAALEVRAYAHYLIALGDFLGTVGRLEHQTPTLTDHIPLQRSLQALPIEPARAIFEQLSRLSPRLRDFSTLPAPQKRDTGEALTLLGMALRRLTEA